MAKQEHLDLLKQGVVQWNDWRKKHWEIQPDLSSVYLSRASLSGVVLSKANLANASLNGADLSEAVLIGTELNGASLIGANLRNANLSRASLRGANLSGASLRSANLSGAYLGYARLNDADLSNAYLGYVDLSGALLNRANLRSAATRSTIFASLDLRTVKGLAEINHEGPSHVKLYTIQHPQDGSASHFLRGTGVPDEWMNFWLTTKTHPVQYYSLFISYSSKDEMLARRLHVDLQAHGVRCWFAPEDLKVGDKICPRIDEAIHLQEKLLLLLSQHALASAWVEDEVEAAIEKENQQQREVLFPVRLDESVMQTPQAWAAKLRRSRHIGDFTRWTDPQLYQQAFDRLLRDLKKADEQQNQEAK